MAGNGKRKIVPEEEFYGHKRPKKVKTDYETGIEGYEV